MNQKPEQPIDPSIPAQASSAEDNATVPDVTETPEAADGSAVPGEPSFPADELPETNRPATDAPQADAPPTDDAPIAADAVPVAIPDAVPVAVSAAVPAADAWQPPSQTETPLVVPIRTRILLVLLVLAVIGFSIFCIVWDIRKGSAGNGYVAGDPIQVTLTQHAKPTVDESLTDASGRYTMEGIAQTVMPSIVQIRTYQDGNVFSTGSGILLTEDGYLATNAHVVNDADSYTVELWDGRSYEGRLVGHDSKTDIAVLHITATDLTPATLGDSDDTVLGESVCALGSPAGFTGSITSGIVSGLNRAIRVESNTYEMNCFQTDAAISPGNSGGALVNRFGQVIGITSSKYGSSWMSGTTYEGLGFAITINAAMPILKELIEQGYVSGRVRIGIQFLTTTTAQFQRTHDIPDALTERGIMIAGIDADADIANTDLQVNDFIVAIEGIDLTAYQEYEAISAALKNKHANDLVTAECGRIEADNTVTYFTITFRLMADTSGDY